MTTDSKYLQKIASLLKMAESTSNENEAEAFMAKAQELATLTSIDLEVARRHQANKERRPVPVKEVIHLGPKGTRHLVTYMELFRGIAYANDIKFDIAHNSTYVIAYGFDSDVEVAKTLLSSLMVQMVRSCTEYLATGEYKKEMVWMPKYMKDSYGREYVDGEVYKPVHGTVARAKFMEAFAERVGQRLSKVRQETLQSLKDEMVTFETENGEEDISKALVLVKKEVEVRDFYSLKSNAKGSYQPNRSSGYSRSSAAAGREAGNKASFGSQTAIGGSRKGLSS